MIKALAGLLLTTIAWSVTPLPRIVVAPNHRYLQTAEGAPFFWLGDTAWLLFHKLDRAEAIRYLENRRSKGFNVIQCMVLRSASDANAYGAAALIDGNPAHPKTDGGDHDFWNHIGWVIDEAAQRGIYVALVPAWGSLVRRHILTEDNVEEYARFLAQRYGDRSNVFWVTGGDVRGDASPDIWRRMGRTLRANDSRHLITYHPFGRTSSGLWFHKEPWLDFDMFQSGHQTYEQDPNGKGEDNWRYVLEDYAREPAKPVLDGEPSYEGIPHGLHDPSQPRWTADDSRRYAYWSVFAGSFGHTYGNNAVMQMSKPDSKQKSYAARKNWFDAIDDPGAGQMQYLKKLILSRPFFERMADQSLVAGNNGTGYDRVMATRGRSYAMVYSYSGRPFVVRMGVITGKNVEGRWYDPQTGKAVSAGTFPNSGSRTFTPPRTPGPGRDWVLVLDDTEMHATPPGSS